MEKIYCESCGYVFNPKTSGYGEIDTNCPICGDDAAAPNGFYDEQDDE